MLMKMVCVYIYSYIHTYHVFFIRLSTDRHLGCFSSLTIVNNAAMSIEYRYHFEIRI